MTSKRQRLITRRIQRGTAIVAIATIGLLLTLALTAIIGHSRTHTAANDSCTYTPSQAHPAISTDALTARDIGKQIVTQCFGDTQWAFAEELWTREADWRPLAINTKSGACGIVQAVPCSKLLNAAGKQTVEATTVEEQMHWGVNYIKNRYGTPQNALEFWKSRKPINGKDVGNWY
jgi:hypothetical protein